MQTTPSNPTTFRRLRSLLASTLLGACVFAGAIAGTAQPAGFDILEYRCTGLVNACGR